jgi:mannitol-specific phosphotransferase system IIBC component
MTITEITQIGTLTLATIAGYLSLTTFRRNKKQELENHLFKIKLEAFSNIAYEIDNFFIALNRAIVKFKTLSEEQKVEELKALSIQIDEQIYKCHSLIVKYSVYFSQQAIENLLLFTDRLLGDDEQANEMLEWINNYYSQQLDVSNTAIEQLREDLQLERLHHSLYTRIKK